MAAGRGTRYGGAKQLDNLGPSGETLLDFAVYDARRAGFTQFVIVTRPDLEAEMIGRIRRFPADVSVTCVVQDDGVSLSLPGASARTRPWGTVHAVLVAGLPEDAPIVALNADDFYGLRAYELAAHACRRTAPTGAATVVGMAVDQTLSSHGPVVRALCRIRNGWLTSLDELHGIVRADGAIVAQQPDGTQLALAGHEIVSMNLWILPAALLGPLGDCLTTFAHARTGDPEAELPLPTAIGDLIAREAARVSVMESPGPWFGLTHPQDRAGVITGLQVLVDRGVYPRGLWISR
jgi:hypothetical protein